MLIYVINHCVTHHLLGHEARVHPSVTALDFGAHVLPVVLTSEEEAAVQMVIVALVLCHAQGLTETVAMQVGEVAGEAFDDL